MKRFLLAGACTLISVAAAAQATNVVREVKADLPAKNTVLSSNTGAITAPAVPVAPVADVKKTLTQPNTVLLDVRTPEEYAAGHLPGAQNLNFRAPDVAQQLQQLDPRQTYVLYCASGNRSSKTAVLMQEKGFRQVVNAGAYEELKKQDVKK
ncbi:rhodanese-like domain-containing protein [Hymenobacter metallilatus]|uniref:Rhodanese-like domain-containing protein n=1 Tax=Hymenobacter metallilatus TaxID=2493666 RepID=A0A428IYL5_9BACT|nr:rhodanese-like domain-containing protein [Hymenobacter metallilatus]RSK24060.1 rhodanese-like domain-containing protein [Hymenobacter metallilatus]